ncbi:MAG: fasciclin domain-containing protein [Paracoccaceae bacterium]
MNRRSALKTVAATALVALIAGCSTTNMGNKDIVAVASSNDDFSTLVAAVSAAGLVETLQGDGPYTVFAPTNEAFAALPAGTVESLLKPENKDKLVSILTYHVVAGNYPASALAGQKGSLATVQGGKLAVNGTDGVKINNSEVIIADVEASNGVIHAIDTVLLP